MFMPLPSSGGSGNMPIEIVPIAFAVTFVFIVLPCLVYLCFEYFRLKREYPKLHFDLGDYLVSPVLIAVWSFCLIVYILCMITEKIYCIIY